MMGQWGTDGWRSTAPDLPGTTSAYKGHIVIRPTTLLPLPRMPLMVVITKLLLLLMLMVAMRVGVW